MCYTTPRQIFLFPVLSYVVCFISELLLQSWNDKGRRRSIFFSFLHHTDDVIVVDVCVMMWSWRNTNGDNIVQELITVCQRLIELRNLIIYILIIIYCCIDLSSEKTSYFTLRVIYLMNGKSTESYFRWSLYRNNFLSIKASSTERFIEYLCIEWMIFRMSFSSTGTFLTMMLCES